MRTFGAEEEFIVVDPATGIPLPLGARLVGLERMRVPDPRVTFTTEIQLQQLESVTQVCRTLTDLESSLRAGRSRADCGARRLGARIVALATSPLPFAIATTPAPRYLEIAARFPVALTCGFHVHVHVHSDDEGVAVLDRIRIWLPVLLALSVNSPFSDGRRTVCESYRRPLWTRLPLTGPAPLFGTAGAYHREIDQLLASGVIMDEKMVYYDARLSCRHPTVEIRIADVCLDPETAVLIAALARALVDTAAREWRNGEAPAPTATVMLQLATWQAGRWGLEGALLDPRRCRPRPARAVIADMFAYLRPALHASGDLSRARALLRGLLRRGTGAAFQRAVFAQSGNLAEVVRAAIDRTHSAAGRPLAAGPAIPDGLAHGGEWG